MKTFKDLLVGDILYECHIDFNDHDMDHIVGIKINKIEEAWGLEFTGYHAVSGFDEENNIPEEYVDKSIYEDITEESFPHGDSNYIYMYSTDLDLIWSTLKEKYKIDYKKIPFSGQMGLSEEYQSKETSFQEILADHGLELVGHPNDKPIMSKEMKAFNELEKGDIIYECNIDFLAHNLDYITGIKVDALRKVPNDNLIFWGDHAETDYYEEVVITKENADKSIAEDCFKEDDPNGRGHHEVKIWSTDLELLKSRVSDEYGVNPDGIPTSGKITSFKPDEPNERKYSLGEILDKYDMELVARPKDDTTQEVKKIVNLMPGDKFYYAEGYLRDSEKNVIDDFDLLEGNIQEITITRHNDEPIMVFVDDEDGEEFVVPVNDAYQEAYFVRQGNSITVTATSEEAIYKKLKAECISTEEESGSVEETLEVEEMPSRIPEKEDFLKTVEYQTLQQLKTMNSTLIDIVTLLENKLK